jgi:hypothetical protein
MGLLAVPDPHLVIAIAVSLSAFGLIRAVASGV